MAKPKFSKKELKVIKTRKKLEKLTGVRQRPTGTFKKSYAVVSDRVRRGGFGPSTKSNRKKLASRERRIVQGFKSFGVIQGQASRQGAGRPRGSFKYVINGKSVPIHVYKRYQSQQRAFMNQSSDAQTAKLIGRGFSVQQIQDMQLRRTVSAEPAVANKQQQVDQVVNQADDELRFKRYMAKASISPNTQQMLLHLRKIQLKPKTDDMNRQRINEEKRLLENQGNLLATPNVFKTHQVDFTGVDADTNILMAESVFKENPEDNILKTRTLNIMNTGEAGNTLKFF